MNMTERVWKILMNANTLRIGFSFRDINGNLVFVYGPHFIMVAEHVRTGKISIVVGNAPQKKAIYTAQYDGVRQANSMNIGANDFASSGFEALIVHEAVHAVFDLTRTQIPWVDNETAAYIAQGFYISNLGVSDENVNRTEFVYLGKMIANDIIAGREIDSFWIDSLRDKLRSDPDYMPFINKTFIGDG